MIILVTFLVVVQVAVQRVLSFVNYSSQEFYSPVIEEFLNLGI